MSVPETGTLEPNYGQSGSSAPNSGSAQLEEGPAFGDSSPSIEDPPPTAVPAPEHGLTYYRLVNFIIKVLVNAAALWVAARFVPGIELTADIWQILLIALVFGLINTFLKPVLKVLSLPVIILTLGLFAIIVNVILLAITAGLMDGLTIDGFLPALLGAIVISIVSAILNAIIPDSA